MDEDVVQAGPVRLERAQREALCGAVLEQRARIGAWREADFPGGPAIAIVPTLCGEHARQLGRVGAAGERELAGQRFARFLLRALEYFAPAREQDEAGGEALGMLHDVGGEDHGGAAP